MQFNPAAEANRSHASDPRPALPRRAPSSGVPHAAAAAPPLDEVVRVATSVALWVETVSAAYSHDRPVDYRPAGGCQEGTGPHAV